MPSKPESLADKTVWVIDAHSLIHQVFHALPEMSSPRGEPVGAVFGFARNLLYMWKRRGRTIFFALRHARQDLPPRDVRPYKAQRPEMPEELVPQIPAIRRVIAALGIPALCEWSRPTTSWPPSPG